ncbi:hypothetical protein KVH22_25275 [Streptomyces olivaceus]|uniref:hypothetical protein n=1 Tax=Streptomyces olivaceus TaxID=47716 RepID=UPI001CCAF390|nr:hypothetical protein [Streptomyces olivaceus]MBZ6258830.1 hypothetical protein [Streptomyces olivaceus]
MNAQPTPRLDARARTHIKALATELHTQVKELPQEQQAQPAGQFLSGILTGLAAAVQILDGAAAHQALETVAGRLEQAIGRAYLNGTLPSRSADAQDQAAPAVTEATELETARVVSALYRPAEDTVTRVITLHEQWVKAGPPPLGASLARWWDARLIELHNAIQPAERPKEN